MVWPLILAGGMTILAEILPKKTSNDSVTVRPVAATGGGYTNLIFTLGLATGVTLTAYFYTEAHKRRWFPYIHHIFLANNDEDENESVKTLENGVIVEKLVSPSNDLTMSVNVTKVTIPVGVTLQMDRRSRCLEFYYVSKGSLTIIQTPSSSNQSEGEQEQEQISGNAAAAAATKLSWSGDSAQHLTLQPSSDGNRLSLSNISRLEECIVLCVADRDDKGREMEVQKESLVAMGMDLVQTVFKTKR